MLVESVSVKSQMLEIINIIKFEEEYLGKSIDAIFRFPVEHQDAIVAYFMEEIGQPDWEELAEDPMLYPEFFKALIVFFSGRKEVGKEPDKYQLVELLAGYLESKHCHDIVDDDARLKVDEMMEGLR